MERLGSKKLGEAGERLAEEFLTEKGYFLSGEKIFLDKISK